MRLTILQPPYPAEATLHEASVCLQWMLDTLNNLAPHSQDLILLPEYANAPGIDDPQMLRTFAERQGTDFLLTISACAKRLNAFIALAALVRIGPSWRNCGLLIDNGGEDILCHDKVHLTNVEKCGLGLIPGDKVSVFEHRGIRMSFAICFDLYFPEYFATLLAHRVDVILCPSYQRSESAGRIRLIAQARAFDCGAHLIRSSYAMRTIMVGGHSLVASPAGAILADVGSEPGILRAQIEPHERFVKQASHGQPRIEHRGLIEAHRRPVVYTRPNFEGAS